MSFDFDLSFQNECRVAECNPALAIASVMPAIHASAKLVQATNSGTLHPERQHAGLLVSHFLAGEDSCS